MLLEFFKDKEFFRTFLKLAMPIAIQNLMISSLNMVDTIMVGRLGEAQIASVGLSNQVFFLLNLLMFGIVSGSAIFMSQYWGKKDVLNIRRVLGLSLVLSTTAAALFTIACLVVPEWILGLFSRDPEVIFMGSQFLRVVSISYIMTAITFCFYFALRSTGQARLPMRVSAMALIINTVLNYVLIFGKLGLPAMGIRGSALGTVIARTFELTLLLTVIYRYDNVVAGRFKELFDFTRNFINRFLHTTIPVILNECLWSVGVTMYSVVYARMGTGIIASINIASTIERIALVLFIGMGNACAVMVGNQIGANDEKKAYDYAKKFITMGPFIGIFMGMLLIGCSGWVLSAFKVSVSVHDAAARILLVIAIVFPIRIFNNIMIVGVLRSGGDTKFSLIMDTAGVWLIAVPLAFVGGLVLKLPVEWVYVLVVLEEVFKFIFGVWRFLSKKWINNLVNAGHETALEGETSNT